MPVYTLPDFNLTMRAWTPGSDPLVDPPAWPDTVCQLYVQPKPNGQTFSTYVIRMPVQPGTSYLPDMIFEIDEVHVTMIGIYFKVLSVMWMHFGFPNQYWAAECFECLSDGTPVNVVGG